MAAGVGLQQRGEIKGDRVCPSFCRQPGASASAKGLPLVPAASPHLQIFLPGLKLESFCFFFLFPVSEAKYFKFCNLHNQIFIKTEKIDIKVF